MHNFLGIKLLIDNQILRDTVLIHLLVYRRSIVDTKKLQHFVHKIYIHSKYRFGLDFTTKR